MSDHKSVTTGLSMIVGERGQQICTSLLRIMRRILSDDENCYDIICLAKPNVSRKKANRIRVSVILLIDSMVEILPVIAAMTKMGDVVTSVTSLLDDESEDEDINTTANTTTANTTSVTNPNTSNSIEVMPVTVEDPVVSAVSEDVIQYTHSDSDSSEEDNRVRSMPPAMDMNAMMQMLGGLMNVASSMAAQQSHGNTHK